MELDERKWNNLRQIYTLGHISREIIHHSESTQKFVPRPL